MSFTSLEFYEVQVAMHNENNTPIENQVADPSPPPDSPAAPTALDLAIELVEYFVEGAKRARALRDRLYAEQPRENKRWRRLSRPTEKEELHAAFKLVERELLSDMSPSERLDYVRRMRSASSRGNGNGNGGNDDKSEAEKLASVQNPRLSAHDVAHDVHDDDDDDV